MENDNAKTRFNFPVIKQGYPVIAIQNALVNDSLSFVLKSKDLSEFNIVVHQGSEVYLDFKITANAKGRLVKLPLIDIPTGIAALTVLDRDRTPLAERLFFAHYPRGNRLSISTEKEEFGKRQKVNLKLKMDAMKGVEDSAIVSVACVQTSRLESSKFQDIENYSYVTSKLAEGAFIPQGKAYLGLEYLENLLLIKGWRKFKDVSANSSSDFKSLVFTGNILKNGRKVDEPISFTVLRDSAFSLLATDNTGYFKMATENLLHGYGRKMLFSVNKPNRELYSVNLINPFSKIDSILAKLNGKNDLSLTKNIENSVTLALDSKILKLKEVVISTKRGNQIYGKSAKNECGDFVCPNNILNCPTPGHDKEAGAFAPVIGERYKNLVKFSSTSMGFILLVYKGCASTSKMAGTFQGVLYAREFYMNDYSDKNLPPIDNQSTIYWNHSI